MSLGENLQFYRKRNNLTQETLAEKMEVSRQTVSKWESDGAFPEMEKLLQLCDMAGCSLDTLLRGSLEEENAEDTCGYDRQRNRYAKQLSAGTGLFFLGMAAACFLTVRPGRELLGAAAFVPFALAALALMLTGGMQFEYFRRKHPRIRPFYSQEQLDREQQRFIARTVGGAALVAFGIMHLLLFAGRGMEGTLSAFLGRFFFLLFLGAGCAVLFYGLLQHDKYKIERYNRIQERREAESRETGEKRILLCSAILLITAGAFLVCGFVTGQWLRSLAVLPAGVILCEAAALLLRLKKS